MGEGGDTDLCGLIKLGSQLTTRHIPCSRIGVGELVSFESSNFDAGSCSLSAAVEKI